MNDLLKSAGAQRRPKEVAVECVRKLRAAWRDGMRPNTPELAKAEDELFLCFLTQGSSPLEAQHRLQHWSGPGDISRAADVSDDWSDETVGGILARTLQEIEENGGLPPQLLQRGVNVLQGCFAFCRIPIDSVQREAEQAVQHAAVRGLLARANKQRQ